MTPQNITTTALALPEEERLRLVEKLLESLGRETDLWDEAAFGAELQRRSAEIDDGKAQLISWEELKREAF
jgi:putative addiction module component (TIGR02574 family)